MRQQALSISREALIDGSTPFESDHIQLQPNYNAARHARRPNVNSHYAGRPTNVV